MALRFFFGLLSMHFLLGSALQSCTGKKTVQIVPDSLENVARIDLPSLARKIWLNAELLDSIRSQTSLDLPNSGIDFMQEAWIFESNEEGTPVPYTVWALSDEDKFEITLKGLSGKVSIEILDDAKMAWFPGVCVVWNKQFALARSYNSLTGVKPDVRRLAARLAANFSADRSFGLPDTADVSFRWKLLQPSPLAFLPPWESSIQGSGTLTESTFRVSATLEESQYLPFLQSFPAQGSAHPFHGFKICILPALQPIWQQYAAFQENTGDVDGEMSSVVEALGDVDLPYTVFLPALGIDEPMRQLEFWAHFKSEIMASRLHTYMQSQLNRFLTMNGDSVSYFPHEISIHPRDRRPVFWNRRHRTLRPYPSLFQENVLAAEWRTPNARLALEMSRAGTNEYRVSLIAKEFHKLGLNRLGMSVKKGIQDFQPPLLP